MKKHQRARISRISIGRVYNLGNYEHVRFELTVDVPEGTSAAAAVRGMERLIAGLRPDKTIKSVADLQRDAARIDRMNELTDEQFAREHMGAVGTRKEITRRYVQSLNADRRRRDKSIRLQEKARALFDDLGGAAQWKDAKLDWDSEDY